jgi:hypothetical protein
MWPPDNRCGFSLHTKSRNAVTGQPVPKLLLGRMSTRFIVQAISLPWLVNIGEPSWKQGRETTSMGKEHISCGHIEQNRRIIFPPHT